jgi:hypothetical protein
MQPEFLYSSRAYQHAGICAQCTNHDGDSQVAATTNGISHLSLKNCGVDDASRRLYFQVENNHFEYTL